MHPFLLDFGSWHIASYGVFVAGGYLIGFLWPRTQMRWMPGMNEEKYWIIIYGLLFGAIAGGKLLYLALSWKAYLSGNYSLYRPWGYVFYGGFIGSVLMGFVVQRITGVPYLPASDYAAIGLPLGHAFGRLGCLAAGCCYGKPTTLPWGIRLGGHPASRTPRELWGVPLHPTQLYESAANLAIALYLLYHVLPRIQKKELKPGTAFLGYILLYSIARFVIEFYRGDSRGGPLGPFYVSQWLALACGGFAAAWLSVRGVRTRRR